MDPYVERNLADFVDICVEEIPTLREVRVFGSYHNGDWKPESSDVDVFVLVDSADAGEHSMRGILSRVPDRRARLEVHTFTPYMLGCVVDAGRGNLCENAGKGRLLYKRRRFLFS